MQPSGWSSVGRELPLPVIGVGEDVPAGALIRGFDNIVPVGDDVRRSQIARNLKLGLPDAVCRAHLTIIANGPSARDVDLRKIEGHTLAVNGALKLFLDKGLCPTYWIACDSQAQVADFLPENPPHNTTYLVAAKCHPSVFHKLRNNDVLVWHLSDDPAPGQHRVPVCTSVTISGAWLMYRMGFTDFEFWGWDGCFIDGRHHASSDTDWGAAPLHINYGGTQDGDRVIGGRNFATTRSWVAESNSAQQFFNLAEYFDIGVTIHGDGMIKAAQQEILPGANT